MNDTIVKGSINAMDKVNHSAIECQLKYCAGIGASAGGVEALQELFQNMPLDTGASFIVVQHLSPDSVSIMDKILQKSIKMPVRLAEKNMELRPSEVYLNTPGMVLEVEGGYPHPNPAHDHVQRYAPINQMLNPPASDKNIRTIVVTLSGSGLDGTIGIGSVKENGDTVIVQKPLEAQYTSISQSVIATGLVGLTENVSRIGLVMRDHLRNPNNQYLHYDDGVGNWELTGCYNQIIDIISKHSGTDFSTYRSNVTYRRIERRIAINKYTCIEDYMDHLLTSEGEEGPLCSDLLIGVTSLFQDEAAFRSLDEHILVPLLREEESVRT